MYIFDGILILKTRKNSVFDRFFAKKLGKCFQSAHLLVSRLIRPSFRAQNPNFGRFWLQKFSFWPIFCLQTRKTPQVRSTALVVPFASSSDRPWASLLPSFYILHVSLFFSVLSWFHTLSRAVATDIREWRIERRRESVSDGGGHSLKVPVRFFFTFFDFLCKEKTSEKERLIRIKVWW